VEPHSVAAAYARDPDPGSRIALSYSIASGSFGACAACLVFFVSSLVQLDPCSNANLQLQSQDAPMDFEGPADHIAPFYLNSFSLLYYCIQLDDINCPASFHSGHLLDGGSNR
jgi:hypothetical protein